MLIISISNNNLQILQYINKIYSKIKKKLIIKYYIHLILIKTSLNAVKMKFRGSIYYKNKN